QRVSTIAAALIVEPLTHRAHARACPLRGDRPHLVKPLIELHYRDNVAQPHTAAAPIDTPRLSLPSRDFCSIVRALRRRHRRSCKRGGACASHARRNRTTWLGSV